MNEWVVVGEEHSGDEDDNVSETEAFGFRSQEAAQQWLDSAETFDGKVVRLRDPNVNAKDSA